MGFFSATDAVMALRLIVALILGAMVGYEREYVGKSAGVRTYSLVSLGACLFTLISLFGISQIPDIAMPSTEAFRLNYDVTRIVSQIVVGIGFLGAGIIIFRGSRIEGLTTAAGFWVAAAIGTTVGFGFYGLAVLTTVLVLFIFFIVKRFEPPDHPLQDDAVSR